MYFLDEFTGRAKYYTFHIPNITPILYGYFAKTALEGINANEPERLNTKHEELQYHRALLRKEACTAKRTLYDLSANAIGLLYIFYPLPSCLLLLLIFPAPPLVDHSAFLHHHQAVSLHSLPDLAG